MRLGAWRAVAILAIALTGVGCAGRWAYRQGKAEARKGNWDLAVARLTRALQYDPSNIDYKMALDNAKIQASRAHHHDAQKLLAKGELEKAVEEFEIASKFDTGNQAFAADLRLARERVKAREEEKQQRGQFEDRARRAAAMRPPVPSLSPRSPVPISINMPDASLQKIFETLAQLAGVNILFDEGFRDKQTSAKLVDVTFQEALDQLTFVNKKFYKVLDSNTIIIAEDGQPQVRRRYDESLFMTFYVQNAEAPELMSTLRQMLQRGGTPPQLALNTNLRAISIAGNADEVALAAKIIAAHDKPLGEVLVEVEILDVRRSALRQYGVELANYTGDVTFDPSGNGSGRLRAHLLSSLNLADFVVNVPNQLLVRFLQNESTARILASPRLRGAEGKQTTLRIGTEIPIPVTTFTATGAGTGQAFSPATSFQYKNVGINMELTPRVNAEGEVTFDPIAAEFSLIGADRDVGGGLKVPEFLTRTVRGTLRVKDGETALIGGLVLEEEREAFQGIIGLQSIPILNRVFTAPKKEKSDSEILISLTPHVVRGPKLSDEDLRSFYAGTKETIRVPSARPPLFSATEDPNGPPEEAQTPGAALPGAPGAEPPSPTTPPVGVAPPPPPISEEQAEQPPPPVEGGPMASTGPSPAPPPAPAPETPPEEPNVMVLFSPPEVALKVGDPPPPVSVIVLRVKELVSVDLAVTFDATALEPLDVEAGTLLTLDGSTVSAEKNLEPGRVRARFSRTGPTSTVPSSGAVALMRFKALKPGPTTLVIESLSLITPRGRERVTLPGPGRVVVLP